jgi:S1-C subfamily serine protease
MDRASHHPQDDDARRARHRRRAAAAVLALGLSVGVGTVVTAGATTATVAAASPTRHGGTGGSGQGGSGQAGSGQTQRSGTPATAQEQTGVVDVDTVLDYGTGEAAGTGIVLTPTGEILTNNHVVQGSTSITVTDVATGTKYPASVVGTDAGDDVAVLRLQGASGLTPAVLASPTAAVAPGTAVTAVGNAGGTGGTPSAASGTVLALGQDITAGDETASSSENLHGLIEVGASVVAGDSGGPLYAGGAVVGMDTAASAPSGPRYEQTADSTATTGYAIPIGTALQIAGQITSGVDNGTIHQGSPAFLGVEVASGTTGSAAGGAPVSGVLRGSPAESAGLTPGDVITSVDGSAVTGPDQLSAGLSTHHVGDQVSLTWVDQAGTSHSGTATLTTGPAA